MKQVTYDFDKMGKIEKELFMIEYCPHEHRLEDHWTRNENCVNKSCENCWKQALDEDRAAEDSEKKEEKNMFLNALSSVDGPCPKELGLRNNCPKSKNCRECWTECLPYEIKEKE